MECMQQRSNRRCSGASVGCRKRIAVDMQPSSGQAGTWRAQISRAGLGVRSANHPSRPPRAGEAEDARLGASEKRGRAPAARRRAAGSRANLRHLLQEFTAGDPMRAGVLWTNLSLRELSRRLLALGTPASRRTIRRALRKLTLGAPARKKKTMGHHPDRNAQFENITRLRREYEASGDAVISIDTKKKNSWGIFTVLARPSPPRPWKPLTTTLAPRQGKLIPLGSMTDKPSRAHPPQYEPRHQRTVL